ncbi:P-glycoprotein 2 [Artemisia annua]|uniref:p-glycoprotein 2 n=1 Tax=Artemisia annua TaxID=35608 RepID=A0A2U1NSH1_ARTAN|nr:P-glycoprotein 2 [Artemisia annua]
MATCDDLLHTNVEQKRNLEKATTCFAHMSSQTRSWSSVLRTREACKPEIVSKIGNENATKNGEGLGHFKFDTCKWPKRKKIDDMNYKFKHRKRKFDEWKWPKRKKERQGAKSHECCVRCGAAGLGFIYSGHISEKIFMKGYGGDLNKAHLKANMLIGEAVSNIRTAETFCSKNKVLDLYSRELVGPAKQSFTHGQIAGMIYGVSQFFIFSSYGLALWYGSVLMERGLSGFKSVMKSFMILIVPALAWVKR